MRVADALIGGFVSVNNPTVLATPAMAATTSRIRIRQLILGVVALMAVSSPQYVWALFVPAIRDGLAVPLSQLQVTIAIFSVCMCGLGPLHGFLAQRMPVSRTIALGGLLTGLGWILSSFVTSLPMLYLTYGVITGLGVGMVYVAGSDLAAQWFPDRRGFAVGMVAGSYGFGAVVTTFPIDSLIRSNGYQYALLVGGAVLALVCIGAALGMRKRTSGDIVPPAPVTASTYSYTPGEMLRTPAYWLLFTMMTLVGTGGLMVISQMGVFAPSFGITPTVLVLGVSALPLALTVDRIANGFTRPLFGWISDHIGRENTMALAFTMEGLSIGLLLMYGHHPVWFVILTAVVFLGWGEIFSLFPATQADMFGPKHQATNLGFLLMSIAVASVFGGPLASLIFEATGSWTPVFLLVSALDLIAAALAMFVLKPMRRNWRKRSPEQGATAH
jgi:MFS transporter, OFA family, oxalate/formate antiporter